jgi:hypothetical protein
VRTPAPEFLGPFLVGALMIFVMVLMFWITLAVIHRVKTADLEYSYRLACKVGDTARADQVEAGLRDIRTSRRGSGRGSGQ